MPKGCEQKVKVSVGLSDRVVTLARDESKRLGISFGDMLRRVTDDWADRITAANKPTREVFVLDKGNGELHRAR